MSIKSKIKSAFIALSFVGVGIFLSYTGLNIFGYGKSTELGTTSTASAVSSVNPELKAPKYFYFSKNITKKPKVSADAYLVGDLNSGEIILAKDQDKKYPIASVSKLMTATILKENQKPEDIVQISKKALATEGENGNFSLNEKIKAGKILYPLLLESSNDAAEAIAISAGRENFIEKMNDKARELQLTGTSFKDPSGLSSENISTPIDLFRLAKYIKENYPDLFQITTNKSYKDGRHVWFSNNQFLYKDGYIGGKSGYTDPAKQTVVSLFSLPLGQSGTEPIAIALLHTPDRAKDVESILKYLNSNIYYGTERDAKAGWVKERTGVVEAKDPDFVTLTFGGDIMLDRGVKNSVVKNFNGDYSALFQKKDLSDLLKKSDITFANLEGTASDKGRDGGSLYSFHMDPSVVPALAGAGIDVLSVANNHVGDWGREAYIDTLSRLKENEILYTGGGFNESLAVEPTIIEKYGMKIGFLGFSDKGPAWMKAGTEASGLLLASNPHFDDIVKNAATKVDYLIVSFHFGEEYQKIHNARQTELAHKAIDDGAKLIIGAHPHVMEDTEVYSPKSCTQSSCMGFIAYSLGNFIFDQAFSADTMQGMLLQVKLWRDGSLYITKNVVKLNRVFQPDSVIKGKEEKVKFTQ